MKFCKLCNTEKELGAFAMRKPEKNGKSYIHSYCKECKAKEWSKHKQTETYKKLEKNRSQHQRLLANLALQAIKDGILKDPR